MEHEIRLLGSLLKTIDVENNYSDTLAFCLKEMEDCLSGILKLFSEINKRMDHNQKLWVTLYGSRCYKFDDLDKNLHFCAEILNKRKYNLFEILKITPYISNKKKITYECDDEVLNVSVVSVDKHQSERNKNEKYQLQSVNKFKNYKNLG